MKVLIIGGTGTISLGIVEECVNRGYDVYALNRGNHNERLGKDVNIIVSNIYDIKETRKKLAGNKFDVIVDVLVYSIKDLKRSIEEFGDLCNQYVFVSTCGIYERNGNVHISENAKKGRKQWDYNREKIKCEEYLENNKDKFAFKYTIVRPTVTYGDRRIPYPVVSRKNQWTLVDRILNNKPIISVENVEFSIINVVDFSYAFVELFNNKEAFGEAFHIGIDNVYRWDDVISIIEEKYKIKAHLYHLPLKYFEKWMPEMYKELKYNKSDSLYLNNAKIMKIAPELKETVNLKEGVSHTLDILQHELADSLVDDEWNKKVDIILYSFFKSKENGKDESRELEAYFTAEKIANVKENIKIVKKKNKNILNILRKIKHFVFR